MLLEPQSVIKFFHSLLEFSGPSTGFTIQHYSGRRLEPPSVVYHPPPHVVYHPPPPVAAVVE